MAPILFSLSSPHGVDCIVKMMNTDGNLSGAHGTEGAAGGGGGLDGMGDGGMMRRGRGG